jgi:TyrR family helix-turn-helix protein
MGKGKIGSTLKGIGPTYTDKIGRYGLRVGDILAADFPERYAKLQNRHITLLKQMGFECDPHAEDAAFMEAVEYLKQFEWQGNIRELENMVQRLMISAKSEHISLIDVMKEIHGDVFETSALEASEKKTEEQVIDLERMVQNFEKNILRHACEQYGSTRKIAKAVGISQTQLVRKKKKYGL